MRKLDDFETERDRFKELIEYAENLDDYLECRYDRTRTRTAHTDAMIQMSFKFKNNYGISIINYGYSDSDRPFECALLYDGHLTYDEMFDDVIGYCDTDECKALMLYVSKKEDK